MAIILEESERPSDLHRIAVVEIRNRAAGLGKLASRLSTGKLFLKHKTLLVKQSKRRSEPRCIPSDRCAINKKERGFGLRSQSDILSNLEGHMLNFNKAIVAFSCALCVVSAASASEETTEFKMPFGGKIFVTKAAAVSKEECLLITSDAHVHPFLLLQKVNGASNGKCDKDFNDVYIKASDTDPVINPESVSSRSR